MLFTRIAILLAAVTITLTSASTAKAVAFASDFYEETILSTGAGPILYWRLNEANAASPAANLGTYGASGNGTYTSDGGTTFGVPGALAIGSDTAVDLPGDDLNYMIFTPSAGFPHPSTALSYEFWVNAPTGQTGSGRGLLSFAASGAGGSDNEFLIFSQESVNPFINGSQYGATGLDLADSSWHHVVVTWQSSDGELTLYDNGVQFLQTNHQSGVPINTEGAFVLGQEQDSVGGGFDINQALNGMFDEVAIYNFVLTPEQVKLHFDVANGDVLPPVPEPSSLMLLVLGALGLIRHTRRRRRKA